LALACLTLAVALAVSGCVSADETAREHLEAASRHLEAYRSADSAISTELARLEGLPESETPTVGAEVVGAVAAGLESQRAEVEAARTELGAAAASGASEELVTYAELQLGAADALSDVIAGMTAYVAALESLYAPPAGEDRTREEADALIAEVRAARDALGPLREEYDERSAEVLRHYSEHDLGVQ
jgi:hypothetical protein